jgi:hypothetical protein
MKKSFKKYEKAGLPGGPNELKRFTQGFIVSQRGQWDYPGLPTAVPTPTGRITMKGVEDDLVGIDNLGNMQYMTPGNEYQFEGDMVYEIPQAKKGGSKKPSKKYSRSLMAKNTLFTKNDLFKKSKSVKNKIFDPNSPYFAVGGEIVSFDFDDTLSTEPGLEMAQSIPNEKYIISARAEVTPDMIERARAAGISEDKIFATGSDKAKIAKIKELGINKHIDNKQSVVSKLGNIGQIFQEGGELLEASYGHSVGNLIRKQPGGETDAMNAMMKARLAYANEFGNPAAQRMIVAPDNPYDFGNGMTGTHYMASMDNYAVPQIQDENGQLVLGDYGPESNEAIRFDRPEDAEYFAKNYKNISPGFIELELDDNQIEEYRKGGYIIEDISVPSLTKAKNGKQTTGIDPAFQAKAQQVANNLGVSLEDLLGIMNHESGLNPGAVNPYTNATGLIQFMPNTARNMGTSVEALKNMSAIDQLDYVERFYKPIAGKAKDIGDLYMFTFLPAAIGKPDNFVIGASGSTNKVFGINQNALYKQNKTFDADKKGYYTVGDVKKRISNFSGRPLAGSSDQSIPGFESSMTRTPGEKTVVKTTIIKDMQNDDWKPGKEEEQVDPRIEQLKAFTKIIEPSLQNINTIYSAAMQQKRFGGNTRMFQDGGMVMNLSDKEIEEYKKGGWIVEDID